MITTKDKVSIVDSNPNDKQISQEEFNLINHIQTWTHLDDSFWPVVLGDDSIVWDTGEGKPVCFLTGMEWMVDGLYGVGEFEPRDGDDPQYCADIRNAFLSMLDRLGIKHDKNCI